MLFSSLRSRNRHSANPNPRLHTHSHTPRLHTHTARDSHRDTHSSSNTHRGTHMYTHTPPHTHTDTNTLQDKVTYIHSNNTGDPTPDTEGNNSHTLQQHTHTLQQHTHTQLAPLLPLSTSRPDPPSPPLLPRSEHLSLGQLAPLLPLSSSRLEFPPCDGIRQPPHSNPPPLLAPTPSVSKATSGSQSHRSFGSEGGAGASQLAYQKGRCVSGDPASKKKPRKSSTPVKIAVTTGEGRDT